MAGEELYQGQPASQGIGIGPAVLLQPKAPGVSRHTVEDPAAEQLRFEAAVERFCQATARGAEQLAARMGEGEAGILAAQIQLVRDPELQQEVRARIAAGQNAAYALFEVCGGYMALFESLDDELMRARAADFADIRTRLLGILTGTGEADLGTLPAGCVLVAEDLSPSQTASLDPGRVAAIVTGAGTRYSHLAILARALGIPAVVALPGALERFAGGETLIVDGGTGQVIARPSPEQQIVYQGKLEELARTRQRLEQFRDREAVTRDGRRIQLAANLSAMRELPDILAAGADGVGLFRTEFLYMDAPSAPEEEAQFQAYRALAAGLRGRPAIVRTLDVGGDKPIPYLGLEKEENPFLGFRGVRFCLQNPALLLTQLRALLRASAFGNLWVMVPMVTAPEEMHRVRELLEQAKARLRQEGTPFNETIPLGAMLETPAAALTADLLAPLCDFFSLGTNDLTQYTLAVDRGNPRVAPLYSTLHPAVLRLVHRAVQAGREAGIPVGVCGEAAADPLLAPFFVGCGVSELSVAPARLLAVRAQLCALDAAEWEGRVEHLLALSSPHECEVYLRRQLEG